MTKDKAVDELQIILDDFEEIRHDIENKLFIRKKTRRLWLKDHQQSIDALYMAIGVMQNEGAEND